MAAIDVLILAGGRGTRLEGRLPDLPKVLAPVGGRPFLDHLLGWLSEQGAHRIVLGLGYRAGAVLDYLKAARFPGLEIAPIVESQPLGTAGAVANAIGLLSTDPVLVVNGDTLMEADLTAFLAAHRQASAKVSMICVQVPNPGRYGRVEIDDAGRVLSFREKDPSIAAPGWINAGAYLFGPAMLDMVRNVHSGSLERDVLATLPPGSIHAFRAAGRFMDIGTPEDLSAADALLARNARLGMP